MPEPAQLIIGGLLGSLCIWWLNGCKCCWDEPDPYLPNDITSSFETNKYIVRQPNTTTL